MSRTLVLAAALLVALSACTTTDQADATASAEPAASAPGAGNAATPPTQPDCNAEAARSVIGQVATADVVERARAAAGAQIARVLKPGQMVTMEFHPSRLNLDVDATNTVTNVRCG